MNKVNLEIVGLTYSESSTGAYVLILGDKLSQRRLPIVIGSAEAESIAVGIEKHRNGRPHTHDLFLRFAHEFGIARCESVDDFGDRSGLLGQHQHPGEQNRPRGGPRQS